MPDGLDRDRVPMAGGALLIAAVATCNLVRTQVVVSLVFVACCLIPTRRFLLRSPLAAYYAILLIVGCLSRECLNLSCLPKPSFADMLCRVGDMSATCLRSCCQHGDIACRIECLNDATFDNMSGIPDISVIS